MAVKAGAAKDERATATDEVVRLRRRGNPLNERTLDVVAGRNKPARHEADETVEGVRNAEDGEATRMGPRRNDATR